MTETRKTLSLKTSTQDKLKNLIINSGEKLSYNEMIEILIIFYSINAKKVNTKEY